MIYEWSALRFVGLKRIFLYRNNETVSLLPLTVDHFPSKDDLQITCNKFAMMKCWLWQITGVMVWNSITHHKTLSSSQRVVGPKFGKFWRNGTNLAFSNPFLVVMIRKCSNIQLLQFQQIQTIHCISTLIKHQVTVLVIFPGLLYIIKSY